MAQLSASPLNWISGSSSKERLVGTLSNDQLSGNGGADTLIGGLGDDTYIVYDIYDTVVEYQFEGIDTVITYGGGHKLSANVENLTLRGTNNSFATGNELANRLIGNTGNNLITGNGGNDVITGGGGKDLFAFSAQAGQTSITDFQTGTGSGADTVRLTNLGFSTFADVKSRLQQVGSDTVLSFSGSQSITFQNTTAAAFTANNFDLPADIGGRHLTFADEFDSVSLDTAISTGTWKTTFYTGLRTLSGNKELERYVDPGYAGYGASANAAPLGLNPFNVSDGVMTITAKPTAASQVGAMNGSPYTSGLLTTEHSFTQTYGYFEVRADLPAGKGLWPAFWLLPADYSWPPEIDVLEVGGSDPNDLHFGTVTTTTGTNFSGAVQAAGLSTGFHTYGVDWRADRITWYLDGVAVGSTATPASMHKPMYMLLNLAVGGTFDGNPDASTPFPAELKIDYVHAYSYDQTNGPIAPLVTFGNATDANDMSDSYTPTLPDAGKGTGFTAKQMAITGLDPSAYGVIGRGATDAVTVINDGAWNTIKDVLVRSTARADVTVMNFVSAEVTLGGDAGSAGSTLTVYDAKRGEAYLGNGNDTLIWNVGGDGGGTVRMGTQDGSDLVVVKGMTTGAATRLYLDSGAGNDVIQLSGNLTGTVTTGSGVDHLVIGRGVNVVVADFQADFDLLQFNGRSASELAVTWSGADTIVQVGGDVRVQLTGVHLGMSNLDIVYG